MPRSMVNMQVNCIPPGRPRVGQVYHFPPQPPSPITPKTYTSKNGDLRKVFLYNAPHAGPLRGRRIREGCAHCRRRQRKNVAGTSQES